MFEKDKRPPAQRKEALGEITAKNLKEGFVQELNSWEFEEYEKYNKKARKRERGRGGVRPFFWMWRNR